MNTLDFGSVFERTIEIYKAHLKTLLLMAAAVFAAVFVVMLVFVMAVAGLGPAGLLLFPFTFAFLIAATFVYSGMVIRVVQMHGDGTEHDLNDLFERVKPVLVPLIFTGLLGGLFVMIGSLFLLVPGIILWVHFIAAAPIVVVENVTYMDALKRSWNLIKGNAWMVFLIEIVLFAALVIAGMILGVVGAGIGGQVGAQLANFVANIFLAPLPAIAGAVIYFQLAGAGAPVGAPPTPVGGIPPAATPGTAPAATASSIPPPPPPSSGS